MTEHLIEPAGAIIRSIDLQYFIDIGTNGLLGLRFKDNEDERVVGVRSKTWKDGSSPGCQFDIEFLLWKLK